MLRIAIAIFVLAASAEAQTKNVFLITADGVRHQELFGGADRTILESGDEAGIEDPEAIRASFWRETAVERREALLPFFWGTLAPRGVVLGSRADGSAVSIENPHKNSFPGYAELLTGRVVPEVTGNIDLQIPIETLLEFARRELDLERSAVAAFTSWEHFPFIVESRPETITVNAGYASMDFNGEAARWSELQSSMRTPWDSVRFNAVTAGLAIEFTKAHRPRAVFIAFDETDEWAHARRYDRTLQAIRSFDDRLRDLWTTLQSLPEYRDQTSLVITTDHGRGRTPGDWTSHGKDVPGCDETWIAVIGPDTPDVGLVRNAPPATNRQVAATVLALLGLSPGEYHEDVAEPIEIALDES